jgi:hypothetical protein
VRLMVRITLPGTFSGRFYRENYETFECRVVRLRGPVRSWRGRNTHSRPDWIYADAILPEQYREYAREGAWNQDGTYPVEVVINHNLKSLTPFLASGDLEWDVRGQE